jgi:glycosyltransferase involved in cell wall biosynthesis
MNTPSFSIVIPSYNRPAPLRVCLEALTQLDYAPFEVIIVDDHSPQPLDNIIRLFNRKMDVRLIRQPENQGPGVARNAGASVARGDFLAFIDDDCRADPLWLREMAKAIASRAIAAERTLFGGRIINTIDADPYARTSQLMLDMLYQHHNTPPEAARFFASMNMVAPRQTFMDKQGFERHFSWVSEDRELCDRWRFNGLPLYYAADALVYHAHHSSLREHFKQHFSYGKGAYYYHHLRAERGSGTLAQETTFHRNWRLWRDNIQAYSRAHGDVIRVIFLLGLTHVANAAGYLSQVFSHKLKRNAPYH